MANSQRLDPWREGYRAAQNGACEADNPYDQVLDASTFLTWRQGYYDWVYSDPRDNYCGGY